MSSPRSRSLCLTLPACPNLFIGGERPSLQILLWDWFHLDAEVLLLSARHSQVAGSPIIIAQTVASPGCRTPRKRPPTRLQTSGIWSSSSPARVRHHLVLRYRRVRLTEDPLGTNLQAIIDSLASLGPASSSRKVRISLVLSNRKAAYGLVRAASATPPIPTTVFSLAAYNKSHPGASREDYDLALAEEVLKGRPDLVVLAGFMHILSSGFLERLTRDWLEGPARSGRVPIINLHPALPGQFDGANAIRRAWEAGPAGIKEITQTGIMVHEASCRHQRQPRKN